jgi:DNA-binding NarL/FixJ family response regulator
MSENRPSNQRPSKTILVVDDQALVRIGLKCACVAAGLISLDVLEAESLAEAQKIYERDREKIELVLLDLSLPDGKGLLGLELFKARHPDARVLAMCESGEGSIAQEARVLGAEKFLHKGEPIESIGKAIKARLAMTAPMARPSVDEAIVSKSCAPDRRIRLSSREIQILNFIVEGRTNREIVEQTQLKIGTVKNYVSGLFAVFGVGSRSKLVSLFH